MTISGGLVKQVTYELAPRNTKRFLTVGEDPNIDHKRHKGEIFLRRRKQ